MKTRIISGIIMGGIVLAVLIAGYLWSPWIITVSVGILAVIAVIELLKNVAEINSKYTLIGASIFVFLNQLFPVASDFSLLIAVIYFIYAVAGTLKNHEKYNLSHILCSCFAPLFISYAFVFLNYIIIFENNVYYLLLLFNFSSVCDMGAYFTGVTIGKHKLCPKISPKKTVEGAIGGILSSIIVSIVLAVCFSKSLWIIALTVPFCILGMIGDLFASAIKRSVDLKDYGNLIPGHGGILDRLDSILMISPVMALLITAGIM